jgi:hypothetical protein
VSKPSPRNWRIAAWQRPGYSVFHDVPGSGDWNKITSGPCSLPEPERRNTAQDLVRKSPVQETHN